MSDYCEMRTMRTLFAEAKGGNNVTSSIFANVACMVKMRKSEGISTQTALTSNSAVECISDIVSNTFFSERENRDRITAIVLLFPNSVPISDMNCIDDCGSGVEERVLVNFRLLRRQRWNLAMDRRARRRR